VIKMRWFFSFGLALFLAASVGCGEAEQKTDDGAPERDAAADDNAQPPDADAPDVDDAEDSVDIEEVDVCVPNCDGRLCGDDGCGNSCGQCATGQECEDGTCVKQCLKLNRTEVTASWKPIHGPDDPRGEFYYQEVEENGDVVSALRLEIRQFHPFNGPQGPGEYDIAFKEENGFGACTICVSFFDSCGQTGCNRRLLATSGTLVIESLDGADASFKATLKDLVLKEVSIDKDYNTYYLKNKETACIDEYVIESEEVRLAVPQPQCMAEGTGIFLDDNIADFELTNCLDEKRNLHEMCNQTKAMWLVLGAMWCPYCSQYIPMFDEIRANNADDIELWVVMGENKNRQAPTAADCLEYAQKVGVDPSRVFYDYHYETVTEYIYPYVFQGIPFSIILDGSNMAYIWSDGTYGSLNSALSGLL
jgi:thiol-disulfide isomerase/thioredoxin